VELVMIIIDFLCACVVCCNCVCTGVSPAIKVFLRNATRLALRCRIVAASCRRHHSARDRLRSDRRASSVAGYDAPDNHL